MATEQRQPLQSSTIDNIPPTTKPATKRGRTIEETFQKKTQLDQTLWVWEADQMVKRPFSYVLDLYKIFDEIFVNAADNKQRDPKMDSVKVTIDVDKNLISVYNNGDGIPVEIHKEEQIFVPELIFGHLLIGSNCDDSIKKTTGGRNSRMVMMAT
ncbi:hypothetical protein L6452_13339 [Arctium lappa]|uniref:Uncharacterized protein n=1 Tax=Arctium lappa TaxID=4217 RepID=A0ACB9CHY1_ARCLA|nr:hypothetical protein L6452_13339 [Arctium lappa]